MPFRQTFVIFDFKRIGILMFECINTHILFPKGNNRQHEHLANADKKK